MCRTGTGYDYRQAKVILNGSGDDTCFTYGNIAFLAGMDESAVLSGNEQYDCILLDLGQADYVGDNILKQCDELFLIGDLSIWHCGESASARFRMSGRYDGRIHLLAAFYSKTGLREYRKLTEDEPVVIPIDMEPFAISRDTIILMESLFGGTYI